MDSLRAHQDYLQEAWAAAEAAPLSVRKAMLVAALVDAQIDRLFAEDDGGGDILAFRAAMAENAPALGLVMAICTRREGFDVVVEAVAVPLSDYQQLSVQDFMVSLYNDHSVQRLNLVLPDGSRQEFHDVLHEAVWAVVNAADTDPVADSVRFDRSSGEVVICFVNAVPLKVPARQLQGLEDASNEELEQVELLGQTGVHWEACDVDFSISGLRRGIYGTAKFMAARKARS